MHYSDFKFIPSVLFLLLFSGCSLKDPAARGVVAPSPERFWDGPETPVCPCTNDLAVDEELKTSEECMQGDDVEIVDLIDTALINNPSTRVTWSNARAAAFDVEIAKSALYPEIVLNESLNYNYNEFDDGVPIPPLGASQKTGSGVPSVARAQAGPSPAASSLGTLNIAPGYQTNLISDVSLSYLLLDFGGRRASIEAAKQALYSSNWIHNRQIQQVLVNVLQAYYNYAGLDALLEARFDDLRNGEANFDAALHQFDAGVSDKLDILQSKTNLINIQLDIVDLEGEKHIAHGALANALGFPSNAKFAVPKLCEEIGTDLVGMNVDELVKLAWDRRPDLASAYNDHNRAKEEVIAARSAGLPTLSTLWDFEEYNDFRHSKFNNHSVSGSLIVTVPIFSGFLYTNQERQAKEVVRAACGNLRDVQLSISQDVITSYFNFKSAVKSLRFARENLDNSEDAYQAAFETYQEGVSTILDLLQAQQSLSESRAQVIQARTKWAMALSNLSFAVGIIGTTEEIKPWRSKNHE